MPAAERLTRSRMGIRKEKFGRLNKNDSIGGQIFMVEHVFSMLPELDAQSTDSNIQR
jgi:hypothetical protein